MSTKARAAQTEGLETAENNGVEVAEVTTTTEKTEKVKKEQTAEDREALVAGVKLMRSIGVSDNLSKVLELVIDWNSDKDTQAIAKKVCIDAFGGSDKLKDYATDSLKEDAKAFIGLAKAIPTLNNIASFYARREGTGKAKIATKRIVIEGVPYTVNLEYYESIAGVTDRDERKKLFLAHPDTEKQEVEEVL